MITIYIYGYEDFRPPVKVEFRRARDAWTWISRAVRSNPYEPIRVPPEFRRAVLTLMAIRQGKEAAALFR